MLKNIAILMVQEEGNCFGFILVMFVMVIFDF